MSTTLRIASFAVLWAATSLATPRAASAESNMTFEKTPLTANAEPMQSGPYEPTWESLSNYQVPEWFRDAKFGIWAHWGPQCAPERGDWYGRHMYIQGHGQNKSHVERFGHPSEYGFKEVIRDWKAENWNPDELVSFYARSGAKYFFAMANHHDNMDLWNSKHQPWNSVNLGPKKDIIAGWAKAARANGLRFGVSVHAAHAWSWFETSQGADKNGPKAGVPYDGKLTKADGVGKWWEGYDPQDLYAQWHPRSREDPLGKNWGWPRTADISFPDARFAQSIYDRTIDLINQFKPDAVYYDDTVLPLYPISDVGMKLVTHQYNLSVKQNGKNEAVVMGKVLNEAQKKAILWDVERGASDRLEPIPWQTCTCIGGWHYDRPLFERNGYKSATTVVHILADVVSKNGNLLLSVPVRGDGTIDEDERKIVSAVGDWLQTNGEAIYATRPWKVFGEGPATAHQPKVNEQGFNEDKGKPLTEEDIRFTQKGDAIYAILMGMPTKEIRIESLGKKSGLLNGQVHRVELLGSSQAIEWEQADDALIIQKPGVSDEKPVKAVAVKVTLSK